METSSSMLLLENSQDSGSSEVSALETLASPWNLLDLNEKLVEMQEEMLPERIRDIPQTKVQDMRKKLDHFSSFMKAMSAITNAVDPLSGKNFELEGYKLTVSEDRRDWIVNRMNEWMAFISQEKEPIVVIRDKGPTGRFSLFFKSVSSMKTLLDPFTVNLPKENDLKVHQHYINRKGRLDENELIFASMRPKEEEADIVPPPLFLHVQSIFQIWYSSQKRRVFSRTIFSPDPLWFQSVKNSDSLNSWGGFYMYKNWVENQDSSKDWYRLRRFFAHLRFTWCENEDLFVYLINYMAHILQYPWIKTEVAIISGGEQGTGKSIVWQILGKILGDSFAHIQNMSDVVGEFTASLMNKILVFVDEVNFSDQKSLSILKNLITGESMRKRMMFSDPNYVPSFTNVVMATNNTQKVFHMEESSRRFVLYKSTLEPTFLEMMGASDKKEYFKKLMDSLEDDKGAGMITLANFLYSIDIENFEPSIIPNSVMMTEQKLASLAPVPRFLYDSLLRGCILPSKGEDWHEQVSVQLLWEEFLKSTFSRIHGAPKSQTEFLTALNGYIPYGSGLQEIVVPIVMTKLKVIKLGELQECREFFEKKLPGVMDFFKRFSADKSEDEIFAEFEAEVRVLGLSKSDLKAFFPYHQSSRSDKRGTLKLFTFKKDSAKKRKS
jgi:hypothetical protein